VLAVTNTPLSVSFLSTISMIFFKRKLFPVPADPVKNVFWPLLIASIAACCSVLNVHDEIFAKSKPTGPDAHSSFLIIFPSRLNLSGSVCFLNSRLFLLSCSCNNRFGSILLDDRYFPSSPLALSFLGAVHRLTKWPGFPHR